MTLSRRQFYLASAGLGFACSSVRAEVTGLGCVVGEPACEKVGRDVLASGGNAVDALAATALVGAVTQLHQTGVGGYGAHGVFAFDQGRKILSLDANAAAPASLTSDIFKADSTGKVLDQKNQYGWLSTGVPGVLAGIAKTVEELGSWSLHDILQPAIKIAKEGFRLPAATAKAIAGSAERLKRYAGSAKLYLPGGTPIAEGQLFKNPELAEMLSEIANTNSVSPFYQGAIAKQIALSSSASGGQITLEDLSSYQALMIAPLRMSWGEFEIVTAPLTAGGFTVLQVLEILKAMNWLELSEPQRTHAKVETMRWCWRDRLRFLGDPINGRGEISNRANSESIGRLRSGGYLAESAVQIRSAVEHRKLLEKSFDSTTQSGTLNFSAVDKHGNMAVLTLTHGEAFGSKVTVEGLGLTLGHGMSRFDVRAGHPNGPGASKRPLNNMCPTIVLKNGRPLVALGGRGGRRIPNAVLEFLIQYVCHQNDFGSSMQAPRFHTEGGASVEYQAGIRPELASYLADIGYASKAGASATLSAVALQEDGYVSMMR